MHRLWRWTTVWLLGWLMAFASAVVYAQPAGWSNTAPLPPSDPTDVCSELHSLSANGLVAGETNGDFGGLGAGEVVTMTATLGTATSGAFRIVGDPTGTNTLAGPSGIPGTLTFTSNGTLPGTSVGVGWFVDAANGGTVNIAVSCVATAIPTTSPSALLIMAACLALGGLVVLFRRRN